MTRTIAQVDAELAAKTHQAHALTGHPKAAELRVEIGALLAERHRLQGPLRPSQVLGKR